MESNNLELDVDMIRSDMQLRYCKVRHVPISPHDKQQLLSPPIQISIHLKLVDIYPLICMDEDNNQESPVDTIERRSTITSDSYNEAVRSELAEQLDHLGVTHRGYHDNLFELIEQVCAASGDYHQTKEQKTLLLVKLGLTQTLVHDEYCNVPEFGLVPAATSAVSCLEKVAVENIDEDTKRKNCNICFEGLDTKEFVVRFPCEHVFHDGCTSKWLSTSHYCPLCRFELPAVT